MADNGYKHTKEDKKRIAEKDANLSNVNEEYKMLKVEISKAKIEYINVKDRLDDASKDLKILELDLAKASLMDDKDEARAIKEEITKVKAEIAKIQVQAKVKKEKMDYLKESLNEKIQELMEDPEIKQHLEYIIRSQKERAIKKARNGIEKSQAKRSKLRTLQDEALKHTSLQNNLRGMIYATSQLNKLETALKNPSLTPDQRVDIEDKINATKAKFEFNKDALFAYVKKNNMDIELSDLSGLLNQKPKMDKNGHVDLTLAFNKEFDDLKAQENQFNKEIAMAEKYTTRLGVAPQRVEQTVEDFEPVDLDSAQNDPARSEEIRRQLENARNPQPEVKLGIFARLKNFFANRFGKNKQQKQLPEPEQQVDQPVSNPHDDYVNSLKYDVMRDLADKYQREMESDIKKEQKAKAKEDTDFDR
jgi:hypothetical protein